MRRECDDKNLNAAVARVVGDPPGASSRCVDEPALADAGDDRLLEVPRQREAAEAEGLEAVARDVGAGVGAGEGKILKGD